MLGKGTVSPEIEKAWIANGRSLPIRGGLPIGGLPIYSLETLQVFGLSDQPSFDNSDISLPLVYTCALCRALVSVASLQGHADWHEKLRRAVDETEMLG